MKRNLANAGGFYSPSGDDFAAKGECNFVSSDWHPPAYLEYEHSPKKDNQIRHWAVSAGHEDSPAGWIYPDAIDLCGSGFVQLCRWKILEPTENNYNFAAIINALNWMETNRPNMKMFVKLTDKSYSSSNGATNYLTDTLRHMPDYLAGHVYQVYNGTTPVGFGPKLWTPYVSDRLQKLITAISSEVGSRTSFAGLIFDESTYSMSYPYPVDYDIEGNELQRRVILSTAKSLIPKKVVVQPINYYDADDGGAGQFSPATEEFVSWCTSNSIQISLVDTAPTTARFLVSMMPVLLAKSPCYCIVDAGRVYPLTDMSAGVAVANMTSNFNTILNWALEYEKVTDLFWPIENTDTFSALTVVLS